jgi:hypothetical protein
VNKREKDRIEVRGAIVHKGGSKIPT